MIVTKKLSTKNKIEVKRDIKIKDLYSLRKSRVKETEDVSVLNPDTNSDSASLKSIGAREISLIEQIAHKGSANKREKRTSSQENKAPVVICVI